MYKKFQNDEQVYLKLKNMKIMKEWKSIMKDY
jgi:hypothetical protein